ncbi:hypothetical protein [Emergencia timonensis]|uniref:hypothetical protein n=1 Tax=Emergencia timonensis TaxID=1776384 RepID=UPI000831CE32|nr:hypothetical protein [Emergencia timonensis]
MNKEDLRQNNTGLQTILAAVKSLPTAKSWGGGGTIIEPSNHDIMIPAYTNVDLTVKGVELQKFGVASGSFTLTTNLKNISLSFDLPSAPKIVIIWHEEPPAMKITSNILRRAVFFDHPDTETVGNGSASHHIARAEAGNQYGTPSLDEGYLYGVPIYTPTNFEYELYYIYDGTSSSGVMLGSGYIYKWIALCV